MNIGDIRKVKIEKLVFGLLGLCHIDNFAIFVDNALPDEILEIEITSLFKSYAKAKIINIIEPSKYRIKPLCPYYNACGSCLGQYMEYDYLIKQKEEILKEIFSNITSNIRPFVKSPVIKGYRKKIQYPTRRTKNSKRLLIGYFKPKTHDITNLKFCMMQDDIIGQIIEYIRNNLEKDISCYDESNNKGLIKNILFRITSNGILLTFVLNETTIPNKLTDFSKKLTQNFSIIKGIFANFNPNNTNKILSNSSKKILGEDFIIETIKDKKYKMGPTSFFQINTSVMSLLFDEIKNNTNNATSIMDAFGGVGAIGIWISNLNSKITLLEENIEAIEFAKENFKLNNIKNFEIIKGDANANFKNIKNNYDVIILDPPRKGSNLEGLKAISKLTKKIIYVSCNPMTLKRDSLILKDEGFEMSFVQGFDMFPYTHHIECLSVFEKINL